jgi:hypothetical protein
MTFDGNGNHSHNGNNPWWRVWKREPRNLDLAAYRRLAFQLHHGMPRVENASRSVLVVTPNESDVWATGCLALVTCMAEELRRPVLLVDADGEGAVSQTLDSSFSPGLDKFLGQPPRPVQELVLATSQPNVWFLPKGTSQDSPLLTSPEIAQESLVRLGTNWDFVVIAGGAVLRNSFALSLSPHVGKVLLLAIESQTRVADIDAAQNALEQCRAQNVSLVLTQLSETVR